MAGQVPRGQSRFAGVAAQPRALSRQLLATHIHPDTPRPTAATGSNRGASTTPRLLRQGSGCLLVTVVSASRSAAAVLLFLAQVAINNV